MTREQAGSTPERYSLEQNYPNPFNPATVRRFTVQTGTRGGEQVRLAVSDLLGREVAVLADGIMPEGGYSVSWNAAGVPCGVYYYTLRAGGQTATRKMILMK